MWNISIVGDEKEKRALTAIVHTLVFYTRDSLSTLDPLVQLF